MKKIVKKTCLLSMMCILLFAFVFGTTGCSASYNEGYKKLHDYVKENDTSTSSPIIQYSNAGEKTHFIFTSFKKKGSSISVYVGGTSANIELDIEKEGVSNEKFLTVEITTPKIGDYYYQGTTLIRSTDQTSFIIINAKHSRISYGDWTDVSIYLKPTLDDYLEQLVGQCLLELYNFIENDIGIPMELFAGK